MRAFEFTVIVELPPMAPNPQVYLDALFNSGCDDATIVAVTPKQISLTYKRNSATEIWAIDDAIREFIDSVVYVRDGAGRLSETYLVDILVDGKRIGDAKFDLTQN